MSSIPRPDLSARPLQMTCEYTVNARPEVNNQHLLVEGVGYMVCRPRPTVGADSPTGLQASGLLGFGERSPDVMHGTR